MQQLQESIAENHLIPQPDCDSNLIKLAQRWLGGETVDWTQLDIDQKRFRVVLPTYPFERQSYWLQANRTIPQPESIQLSTNGSTSASINGQSDRTSIESSLDAIASPDPVPIQRYARPNLKTPYVAPTNSLEEQVVTLWQEVLRIEQVGIHDNFFELGGDSLIATQLVARAQSTFAIELPLRDLLADASTVVKQAEMIEALLLEKIEELSEEEAAALLAVH